MPAARALVAAKLGPGFTEALPLDLGACLADSAPGRPLIFVLSPGADPMAALAQLAAARGLAQPASVSLGQGQGGRAGRRRRRRRRLGRAAGMRPYPITMTSSALTRAHVTRPGHGLRLAP